MDKKLPYSDMPPLTTWQFFHAAKKILGDSFLQKVYKKSLRQIYRWSANPDFCEDTEKNPLDRIKIILGRLVEIGREDVAYSAVQMLAEVLDCELVSKNHPTPDKSTIEDECLDDYPTITAFHNAIREGKDKLVVQELLRRAKGELEETYEKFLEDT